ncbi:MAG: RNA polymerase factor sigma-54 [Firmicutes bacterium]|nr:RNA polymerase factor sigma-54 [Bacillota bacterium]
MRLGFGLSQEQTQKLVMTPELRLAIKILQLSTIELVEYIDEQLVENPVLEVVEESAESEPDCPVDENKEAEVDKNLIDWERYFEDIGDIRYEGVVNRDQESMRYDNFITEVPTLQDHLMFQLALAGLNKKEWAVGEFLIGNIDDNGYLHCSPDEAAIQCDVSFAIAEKVLKTVHGFDPAGVGARDLRECLLIQYEQLGLQYELLKEVISNHLQELAEGKIMKVAKKMGVSLHEMQSAVDHLKLLEPKPGRKFSPSGGTRYIVPDIVVEKIDGEYIIIVNDVSAPRLTVNPIYREMVKGKLSDQESRKFLEAKLNAAVWLMKSIEQRRGTLYKVAMCIVDYQRDFFEQGVKFLKPMILKHVAEATGLHESTVSRATAGKYIQTPRGLFEMRFFFSSGISNVHGLSVSSEAIKKTIRELVEGEDTVKPLSDQKIAEILEAKGVDISRRTIAKYRDEMGIAPKSRRRRY